MKASNKKVLAILIVFAMVLTVGFDSIKAFALQSDPQDTIEVNKTAKELEEECRTYEVMLEITGTPPEEPLDIILVIDRSGSMEGTPMANAKAAAKSFAETVLGTNNDSIHRIAVVSFAGPTSTNGYGDYNDDSKLNRKYTNKLSDVKSTINALSANGGTNTEAGLQRAENSLNSQGSRSNARKVVVFMSDGVPTASNNNKYGPSNYPTIETNHITAAKIAGTSLKAKADVFSIGLFDSLNSYATTKGLAVGVMQHIHNRGYYDAPSSSDLDDIYDAISTQLGNSATNTTVTDVIGDNFEFVPGSQITDPVGSPFNYDPSTKTITWEPGIIGTKATLTYKVKANEDFAGGEDVPTNEWAEVIYNTVNLKIGAFQRFPIPKVDVEGKTGSIEIVKQLFDEDTEEPILDDDTEFTFVVTGPNGFTAEVNASVGSPGLLEELEAGEYIITELEETGYTNLSEQQEVNLVINHCSDDNLKTVIFSNLKISEQSGLGSLEIEKIIQDIHGDLIDEGRSFLIVLTGPSFPTGEEILITNTENKVIDNLIPGSYTIEELNADYFFEITIDESPVKVDNNQRAKVTITNKEKKIGELTVNKILLDKDGDEILEDEREFKIKITGPNGYNESISLKGGKSETLTGLEYGEYTAVEENGEGYENIDDYLVSVSGAANLTYTNRSGSITLTNREREEDIFIGDIEIIKKVEFGEKELGKLANLRDLLNGLFKNGGKSDLEELAEDVNQFQIDEAEALINSLLEFGVQDFAQQFIIRAQYLLDNPPYISRIMLESETLEEEKLDEEVEIEEVEEEKEEEKEEVEEFDGTEVSDELNEEDVVEDQEEPEEQEGQEDPEEQEGQEEPEEQEGPEAQEEQEDPEEQEEQEEQEDPEEPEEQEEQEEPEEQEETNEPTEDADEVITEKVPQSQPRISLLAEPENLELEDILENADLSGFEFVLYELVDGEEEYRGTVYTDSDGKATFPNMPEGTYVLKEILGDVYFSSIDGGYEFYFNVDTGPIEVINTVDDEFNPEPDPMGRIVLEKVDIDTGRPLSGARFEVRDENGVLVDVLITNSEGLAFSINLPFGQYTVEEVQAPSGYILDSYIENVTIESEEGSYMRVYNRRRPVTPDPDPDPDPDPEDPGTPDTPDDEDLDEDPIPEAQPQPQPQPEPELPEEEEEDDITVDEPIPEAQPEPEPEPEVDAEDTVKEDEEEVEESVPQAKPTATLPKTGAASPLMATGFGTLLLAIGLFIRRKRR